jgi:glyoxylase-like metal-dependent hydrolase (beta-lactamase superfamily II)
MKVHTLDLEFFGVPRSIAVFVVESAEGLALVESGPASTLPHLQQVFQENGWKMADFRHVFLTHIHFDHAGAAWAFADHGAKIYVHPKGLPHMAQPEKLYNSARMIYGEKMDRLWGEMRPIAEEKLYAPQHGECIEVLGLHFKAWYTPGHAVHHIAWEVSDPTTNEAVIFTGDVGGVRMGNGPVMPPCPPPDIQVEDWQQSIRLLRELPVERLMLTHYGEIQDKQAHLDSLEQRLLSWANWMKPHAEANALPEELVPAFQTFVQQELLQAGVPTEDLPRYEAANPAYMSVAGLLRYWKKKAIQTLQTP